MDYLRYWSLYEKPFGRTGGTRFFQGFPQREAIARLHYLVAGGISCGILLSPGGCGVTTLLGYVATSNGLGDCAVDMLRTRGDQPDQGAVYADLADALGIVSRHPTELAHQIPAVIDATSRQSVRTVWLIDGCGVAAAEVARRLIDRQFRFSAVMAADSRSAQGLAITLGCCPLRIELPPLSLDDTSRFVHHALRSSGASQEIFTDAAMVRLHEIGQGRIGILTSVAELALIVGAAHEVPRIEPGLIETVQDELVRAA